MDRTFNSISPIISRIFTSFVRDRNNHFIGFNTKHR